MIKFEKICKTLGGRLILDHVSFQIDEGKCTAIVGPSGAGKTTLTRMINGLEVQDGGEIYLDSERVNPGSLTKIRNKIGFVFQNFNLFPHMSAFENLTYAPINVLNKSKAEVHTKAVDFLNQFCLMPIMHYYPNRLSGGQKQRIAIIRALMMDPKIVILDEPTSALDPTMVNEVVTSIKILKQLKVTVIVVTHQSKLVKSICDDVIFMEAGRVVEHAQSGDFFASTNSIVQNYLKYDFS